MPALQLLAKLIAYYAVMAALLLIALWLYPSLQADLPIGRVQSLLAQNADITPAVDDLTQMAQTGSAPLAQMGGAQMMQAGSALAHMPSFVGSLIWLGTAILGAMLAALPVSWVYMNVRNPDEYDQSLVDTIVVLPLVVTGIVVVVQHSLALAFSLAGIAGAVRYRNTLKSSGDLLFILLSIGIGLSAGIGAVELAVLSSAAFNLCFIMLWLTNYGERRNMKRFLSEFEHGHPGGRDTADTGTKAEAADKTGPHDRRMKHSDFDTL